MTPLSREALARAWAERSPRERGLVMVGGVVLGASLLWLVLAPAWRTVRAAPAQLEVLDGQLQAMQRLATEAQALRSTPPLPPEQARAALQGTAARLGEAAKLTLQGERAVLTITALPAEQLMAWLTEARVNARARVVETNLMRTPQGGYSGSVVLALGGAP